MHVVRSGRARLPIRAGNAEEEGSGIIASLRRGTEGGSGSRVVNGRGITVEGKVRLIGMIGYGIEILLPETPAKLDLMTAQGPGIILLDAEDLRELAARHNAVELDELVAGIEYIGCTVHIERIWRAELRRNVLLSARLVQTILPIN